MKNGKYSMAFTTGGLFLQDSLVLGSQFIILKDWTLVRDSVLSNNLLQLKTLSSQKRVYREVVSRLQALTSSELDLLINGDSQEQRYILWVAICRRYQFIGDFAIEVIREHYLSLNMNLYIEDFDSFLNKKSEWHPELDKLEESTRTKLRQVLFKILREADIIDTSNTINPAMLSSKLLNTITNSDSQDILVFPVFEADVRRFAKCK